MLRLFAPGRLPRRLLLGLILVAAITIIYTALKRFLNPAPLESLGVGLVISLLASAINFGVARFMFRKAEQYDSITLEADAQTLARDAAAARQERAEAQAQNLRKGKRPAELQAIDQQLAQARAA